MQQAARSSDYTAFMYLGELIEFDETETIFTHPSEAADRGLHHRPLRLSRWQERDAQMASEHIVKSYDEELDRLNKIDRRDGRDGRKPARRRDRGGRQARQRARRAGHRGRRQGRSARARSRQSGGPAAGAAPADGARPARGRRRAEDRQRSRTDLRLRRQCRQALDRAGADRRRSSRCTRCRAWRISRCCWSRT